MYVHKHIYNEPYIHTYIHTCMHTYTYTNEHSYMHTHMHTHVWQCICMHIIHPPRPPPSLLISSPLSPTHIPPPPTLSRDRYCRRVSSSGWSNVRTKYLKRGWGMGDGGDWCNLPPLHQCYHCKGPHPQIAKGETRTLSNPWQMRN